MPVKSTISPKAKFIKGPPKNAPSVAKVPIIEPEKDEKIALRVLPEQKRKVLEDLLNRGKVKANVDKLKDILTQKLLVKYGSTNKHIIIALVEEFLSDKEQITGEDLGRLEREVIVALKAKRVNMTPASLQALVEDKRLNQQDGGSQRDHHQQQQQQQQQQQNQQQEPQVQSNLVAPPPGSEWSVIAAYQELLAEEKVKQEQQIARMKKINFRQSLDEHIQQAKILRAKTEDRTDKEYSEQVNKDVLVFREQEKIKRAALHEKHHAELVQRKQQILDKAEKARAAKMAQLEDEYRDLALAAQKIEEERQKQASIRKRAVDNQAVVDKDNKENERLRELKRIADTEEDARLMKEYAARMDAEEAARASAFQKRMDEMAKFAEKFENEGAGKVQKEERIKMEQLLLLEQKRKEEADAAKEVKKAEERRKRLQQQMEENTRLLERKMAKEASLRKEDAAYQSSVMKDVEKYKMTEAEKLRKHKEQQLQYRVVLDTQMKTKVDAQDPKSAAFVGREKDINSSLLAKALDDPKVLSRVTTVVAGGKSVVTQPMKIVVNK